MAPGKTLPDSFRLKWAELPSASGPVPGQVRHQLVALIVGEIGE
jgi:hypothetical protein